MVSFLVLVGLLDTGSCPSAVMIVTSSQPSEVFFKVLLFFMDPIVLAVQHVEVE